MLLARARLGRRIVHGAVEGDELLLIRGGLFGQREPTGERVALAELRLLAPTRPSKVLAIGLNYRSHLASPAGAARPEPARPEPFIKTPSSVIGPGEAIVLPPDAGPVHEEGEVVAVIGRRGRNIPEDRVDDYILGYTCGNDVSARDWQQSDLQWWRAKSSDTFTAVGPWIATGLDPERIGLRVRVNGEEVQAATTADLIHSIRSCVSTISRAMTLERGDLVFTGTPGATRQLAGGDRVEVEVDGVGVLSNPVAAGS
ncbi:MAG: fumarylacetoacetate hydrolase family protein [Chloroflexi bacterium]|nr:fumarylacetoacetate hydrolase family protein [Chloroflexota bacterium]